MLRHRFLLFLFAFSALTFAGCDSTENDDSEGVFGRWKNVADEEYLNISADDIIVHEQDGLGSDACFVQFEVEVVSIDGSEWTLQSGDVDDPGTQTIRLERDGDDLVITFDLGDSENSERYEPDGRTDFTPLCDN
jgi:hypothetical protein